jgi:hypothetical protein
MVAAAAVVETDEIETGIATEVIEDETMIDKGADAEEIFSKTVEVVRADAMTTDVVAKSVMSSHSKLEHQVVVVHRPKSASLLQI